MSCSMQELPAYALIIRATWERGATQARALAEMKARGIWPSHDQLKQAGLLHCTCIKPHYSPCSKCEVSGP